jgi:hypothetical protein
MGQAHTPAGRCIGRPSHLALAGLVSCSLNPEVAALLPALTSLRRLVLDGDGVDDAAMHHIASLPLLRCGGRLLCTQCHAPCLHGAVPLAA